MTTNNESHANAWKKVICKYYGVQFEDMTTRFPNNKFPHTMVQLVNIRANIRLIHLWKNTEGEGETKVNECDDLVGESLVSEDPFAFWNDSSVKERVAEIEKWYHGIAGLSVKKPKSKEPECKEQKSKKGKSKKGKRKKGKSKKGKGKGSAKKT